MTWRDRLALLLGAASPFTVLEHAHAASPAHNNLDGGHDQAVGLQRLDYWSDPAREGQLLQLIGHRSHSSHSSHRSHSSHVSGSGHSSHYSSTPSYRPTPAPAPAPIYTPPPKAPAARTTPKPPPSPQGQPAPLSQAERLYLNEEGRSAPPARSTPPTANSAGERLSQDEISSFVQRVQIALLIRGYDPGPADGVLTEKTREALRAFQHAGGLTVSGAIDKDTLHALGVLK